jgi:DNA-binding NtrC family response regulator
MSDSAIAYRPSSAGRKLHALPKAGDCPPAIDELVGRVLVVEDNARARQSMVEVLTAAGHEAVACSSAIEALKVIQRADFDVIITDLQMPAMDGLAFMRALAERKVESQIVMVTAFASVSSAVEAMRYGAFDYIEKPFDVEQLESLVARALRHGDKVGRRSTVPQPPAAWEGILIGASPAMQQLRQRIAQVAPTDETVLITGESGTGKELVARCLHLASPRSDRALVGLNCPALSPQLMESELFGHERGAFTGADARRIGRFEQASGGTLFLDEIGDMTPGTQAKLLRVLQEKAIQRVGGKESVPVDVRILAATHRDLESAIAAREFREDLFFRLSVVTISLPPLSRRSEDIPDLVQFFLRRYGSELGFSSPAIQPEAVGLLQAQPWPGNVRQLENVVRQALLLSRGYPIGRDHVQSVIAKAGRPASASTQTLSGYIAELLHEAQRGEADNLRGRIMDEVERELFSQAIQLAEGNQARAARWLGITRLTLREKLLHFGLHPSRDES